MRVVSSRDRWALAGCAGLLAGASCAGAGNRGHLVAAGSEVAEEDDPTTPTRWTFLSERREQWHSNWILLPDGRRISSLSTWSWVPALPGDGEAGRSHDGLSAGPEDCPLSGGPWNSVTGVGPRWYPRNATLLATLPKGASGDFEDPAAASPPDNGSTGGRAVPASATGKDRWANLNGRRPWIVRSGGGREGTEVLEIEVSEGDGIGSITLVSVDALLGKGDPSPIVEPLRFKEVGSWACPGSRRRVSVAIEGKAVPAGTYLVIAVAESGTPSAGELLLVEPVLSGG